MFNYEIQNRRLPQAPQAMTSNKGNNVIVFVIRLITIAVLCLVFADGYKRKPGRRNRSSGYRVASVEVGSEKWHYYTREEIEKVKNVFTGEDQSPCYPEVGCFKLKERMRIELGGPEKPEEVGTRFFFYSPETPKGEEVSLSTWNSIYQRKQWDLARSFIVIIHGFTESGEKGWVLELKDALLGNVGSNVLVVDWAQGAAAPLYPIAARNTPMPGVLLALLIKKIMASSRRALRPEKVHIIGFSLGAQVAGFSGRYFYASTGSKYGRITGLDPAGPLFDGSTGCLSKEDANFLDVIHANAGSLAQFRYGLNRTVGDVDFWPNGGSDQPGCHTSVFFCSHYRAPVMFIESLTRRTCQFTSYFCRGGWPEYESGECKRKATPQDIGEMGYYSNQRPGRNNQYLKTNPKPPYCIPQNRLKRLFRARY